MASGKGILVGALAAVGTAALLGAIAFAVVGVSARSEPPAFEVRLARAARHRLIPRAARAAVNPVAASPEALDSGMRHWADHCASCHANDGKGDTALGRGLYPRAPDMTLAATRELSDGELFWIIENGVKLTGMPAWGDPSAADDTESWELVHFVRHLGEISEEELRAMERLNPISREDLERQLEIERFLAGGISAPSKTEVEDNPQESERILVVS